MPENNKRLVLIGGESGAGKSASFHTVRDPENMIYLNAEGKDLPFAHKFKALNITDPLTIFQAFQEAENMPEVHSIGIDSLTFLMDMYESQYVLRAKDTQKGWQNYQQYFKSLMHEYVARSTKTVVFTAHTAAVLNTDNHIMERKVSIKGALKDRGVEAYFSTIVAAKKMPLDLLEPYINPLLTITPHDERIGYKHVFQTQLTKDTTNERIKANMGMWDFKETYINNDVQILLDRLNEYYGSAKAA